MKKAISACLTGVNCRYNGTGYTIEEFQNNKDKYILICPEISGGLPIPRNPVEIKGKIVNNAYDDLVAGKIKIVDKESNEYSKEFIAGVNKVLKILRDEDITEIILKENSPSCGVEKIYDGTFKNNKIAGEGVLTALLRKNGIKIKKVE